MPPRHAPAVFAAVLALLGERGYDDLTVEEVAIRAKVNKTTIYRWWSGKAALVGAALVEGAALDLEVPDTGSLRGDLLVVTRTFLELLTAPETARIATEVMGAASHNAELAAVAQNFFAERLERERIVVERAHDRGELDPDIDPMLLMDLLGGAIWMRTVFRGEPAEPHLAEHLVDAVLSGVSTRA